MQITRGRGSKFAGTLGINVSHGNNGTARSNFPAHKFLIGFSTQNSIANGRIENRLGHYARLKGQEVLRTTNHGYVNHLEASQ